MNVKKGIITGIMALLVGTSTLSNVYAQTGKQSNVCTIMDKKWNFKTFSESLKKDISKVDLKKAQELFEKATKFDKDASVYWEQLFALNVLEKVNMEEEMEMQELTFKDIAKEFKKDVKAKDLKRAEKLFNQGTELEKNEKYEEADKIWEQFFELIFFDDLVDIADEKVALSFEDFASDFKKDVKPEVKKEAKVLYEKILKLEKDGKYDEADKVWESLNKLDLYEGLEKVTYTFEDFEKTFKEDLKPEVKKEAKALYDKISQLEKDGKYDEADKLWDSFNKLDLYKDIEIIFTFDFFAEGFKKDVKPEVKKKAKALYENMLALQKDGKYDEADKVWESLNKLDLFEDMDTFTFEDLAKDFKKDVKPEAKKEAKVLYEKISQLEKDGKYDEADKLWESFYNLDLYEDVDMEMDTCTFEDFANNFKKDVKPETLKKAEALFEKAVKAQNDAIKLWDELFKMDIYNYDQLDIDNVKKL